MKCLTTEREELAAYPWFPPSTINGVRHSNFIERTFGEAAGGQGHRPAPRRDQLQHPDAGRVRPFLQPLARPHRDRRRPAAAQGPALGPARTTPPPPGTPATKIPVGGAPRNCPIHRVISPMKRNHACRFTPGSGRHRKSGARRSRHVATNRLVTAEAGFKHAFAATQSGQLLLKDANLR